MPIPLRQLLFRPGFSAAYIRFLTRPKQISTTRAVPNQALKIQYRRTMEGNIKNDVHLDMRSESPLSDAPEVSPVPKPKRQPRKRKSAVKVNATDSVDNNEVEECDEKRKKQTLKRKAVKKPIVEEEDGSEAESKPPPKRKRKVAASVATGEEDGEDGEKKKKKRRRKTPEEDKVYDILPIENVLSTTFKGRLGYACLNTILRRYSTPIFCSRTCRLSTLAELGPEHLRGLALQNVRDLHTLVTWNAQNGIFFMRMSSEIFPFASHPEHGYDLSFADAELKAVGKAARELGVRLTTHPGQFTQLGSPREVVVQNAVSDLKYHCEMMDRMGLDQDSIMIIHMGGTFNDKSATLERFKENYLKLLLDNVKGRLVLENDELCYNVDDLLPICQELRIPLVFDYHHDWIYPSARPARELIPEINQLWRDKGIRPKQHYSEPRPGAVSVMERRAHSDRVKTLPEDLPDDMDLMLECKDKEQAVFYLYRLYGIREVDARALRPPAEVESMHTNGRKSTKRARAKAAAAAAAEDHDIDENNIVGEDEGEDGADVKLEIKAEVEREAEEHGLPADETETAVIDTLAEGGLECGSGDEAPEVDAEDIVPVLKGKAKGAKEPRAKKAVKVADRPKLDVKASQKAGRRRGKVSLKLEA